MVRAWFFRFAAKARSECLWRLSKVGGYGGGEKAHNQLNICVSRKF